ncbi:MAG: restriction endonuclease subunit S [Nitrospiraceae bacterium]|nr:MAG: restriction endonuclease subunit S [Nitrospiraceae bacterium]
MSSMLPKGWKKYNVRQLAKIDEDSLGNRTRTNYKFNYISLSNVNNGVISEDLRTYHFSDAPSRARRCVKKNDVLMATVRPNLEGFARIKHDIKDTVASTGFAVISPNIESDSEYIYQYLYSYQIRRQIYALVVGSNYPAINSTDVIKLRILAPTLPKTRALIGKLLLTWDMATEKTERLIEAKEKSYKWLIKTLINDQCQRWKHLRSEKIFESVSEKNHPKEELLSVTQDRGVIPRTMLEGRVMSPDGSTASYKLIKRGDFVISLRSFQGGVEYSEYQGIVSPAYTVLRNKLPIHEDFYRHFFKSYIFIEKYLRIAVIGIRDGKQISMPDFKSVKLPYPPIDDQEKIANVLNTAQKEIGLLRQQLELLKKQKRGLMQKLLTGQWRVKT